VELLLVVKSRQLLALAVWVPTAVTLLVLLLQLLLRSARCR
jgi:hypothetical protein